MNWRKIIQTGSSFLLGFALFSCASHPRGQITKNLPVGKTQDLAVRQVQGECRKKMGPYLTEGQAKYEIQRLRTEGNSTSNAWGEGGVISDWSNRRYYFNLFYPC